MTEIIVEDGAVVGELTTKQNRAFDTNPMILVEKYQSRPHEKKFETLEISRPVIFGPCSCTGARITTVAAKKVVAIQESAFAYCTRLNDLRHLNISPDTDVGYRAFYNIATDDTVDYIMIPPMTEEQLRESKIVETKTDYVRNDIWFHAPDDATGKALVRIGVPVRYPDGTKVGWCRRDTDRAVRRAIAQLDAGKPEVHADVGGVSATFRLTKSTPYRKENEQ